MSQMDNIRDICIRACNSIKEEEKKRLSDLYRLPVSELKRTEHTVLIQNAVELPLIAQKKVKALFDDGQIKYFNMAWRDISSRLPQISYVYIQWDLLTHNQSADNLKPGDSMIKSMAEKINDMIDKKKASVTAPKRQYPYNTKDVILRARNGNFKRLEKWCADLEKLMESVMMEYAQKG